MYFVVALPYPRRRPLVTLVTVAGATAAPSIVGRLGPVGAQVRMGCCSVELSRIWVGYGSAQAQLSL